MLIGPSANRAGGKARVDHRAQPPRTDDNAGALPSSFRDAGNRISFDELRGFTETRDSAIGSVGSGIARAIRLTRCGFSVLRPRPSSRLRPVIHSRRAGALGAERTIKDR